MNGITRTVRSHPIAVFALLACLFGWGIWIAWALGAPTEPDNMPLGPVLAAAIVTAFQGRDELRTWGLRLRNWRAVPAWYAVAIAVPALVDVAIVLVNHAFGAPLPTGAQLADWPQVPVAFLIMLVMVGFGEEAGWSAFAAPYLLPRYGLWRSWLVLGSLRTFWHLPLLLSGDMNWVIWLVGNASFQLVVLRLMQVTDNRWTLAAVWHATLNAFGGGFFFTMVTGADKDRLGVLLGVAYALVALATVLPLLGGRTRRRPDGSLGPASRISVPGRS